MEPQDLPDKLNQLAAAQDAATARLLATEALAIIHAVFPMFPSVDFTSMSLAECQAWGVQVAATDWSNIGDGG